MADPIPVRRLDGEIYRVIVDKPGATTTDIAFTVSDITLPAMVMSLQRLIETEKIVRDGKGYRAK